MSLDQCAYDVLRAGADADLRRIAVEHERPQHGDLVRIARCAIRRDEYGGDRRKHRAGLRERQPALSIQTVSAGLAHFCVARAFYEADASFILSLDFLRLPVTAAAGYVLFAEIPDLWTVAGAAIIFGSTWYLNWHERVAR